MNKKQWRAAALVLAVVVAATGLVANGFKSRMDAMGLVASDLGSRNAHLHSLWENMCIDNGTERPDCEAAWERAQRGP